MFLFVTLLVTVALVAIIIMPTNGNATLIPDAYIVEYSDKQQGNSILSSLDRLTHPYHIRQTYASPVFNGLSLHLSAASRNSTNNNNESITEAIDNIHPILAYLYAHPGVRRVYPVRNVPRPQWVDRKDINETSSLPYDNNLTQLKGMYGEMKLTGAGVTVGIIDSGVDYDHPAFGGFGAAHKIRFGHNFVDPANDDEHAGSHRLENDPYDLCPGNDGGHGTHVTGIVSGVDMSKNFSGIAPNVTIGAYRIFGCTGGAAEDVVIKAMEMAYEAGCDIINLSLSVESAWPENPMAVVADRLAQKGAIVVTVAGNQGGQGVFMQTSPGSGTRALTVGSMENTFRYDKVLHASIFPNRSYSYALSTSTESMPDGKTLAIVFDEEKDVVDGCSNSTLEQAFTRDKILLLRRGSCSYDDKLEIAKQLGAAGVLFFDEGASKDNNDEEPLLTKTSAGTIPSAGIANNVATKLVKHYRTNTSMTDIVLSFPSKPKKIPVDGPLRMSSFSSTGPTYELGLKPTITGIGSDVFSTLPRHINGGWGILSGTSMASPQVAGMAALMLEWYRRKGITKLDPVFLAELMQNHAMHVPYDGTPEHPLRQGAGFIQPMDALQSTVHVSPGYLSFNDTDNLQNIHQLRITNGGSNKITLDLSNRVSQAILPFNGSTGYTPSEPSARDNTSVSLVFTPPHVVVQPGESINVQVAIHLPSNESTPWRYQMYGGFIEMSHKGSNKVDASVPYFGVLSSVHDLPLFDAGYPYLTSSSDASYNSSDTFIFNVTAQEEVPKIVYRLLTATARADINVVDERNTVIGAIDGGPYTYLDRNNLQDDDKHSSIEWNGRIVDPHDTSNSNTESVLIQPGTYRLHMRALRLLGDPQNASSWQEWISSPIMVVN